MEKVRRLTITDVAAAAGVSKSTASRALSGNGYAAPEVRDRVFRAAQEIGYLPDINARNLRQGSRRDVGVVISDLRDPFYAELASGIESGLRQADYHMVLVNDCRDEDEELGAALTFASMRVPGAIVTPRSPKVVRELLRHGVRVVQADRLMKGIEADSVVGANQKGGRLATAHLLEAGHRRIAMLIDEAKWTTGAGRLAGYRAAHKAAGVPVDDALITFTNSDAGAAAATLGALLVKHPDVTAILAVNNLIAQGCVEELQRREISIPDRISLVCYDDVAWMSMVRPALTTVDQHAEEMGRRSAQLLISRLDENSSDRPIRVSVEPTLVVRDSVAPVKIGHRRDNKVR
ncbi:MAG TPA: LacI family DNA-binding transcriptional regulator [Mycobacteriales bacterium]|nr:LacI family DNA-binding transcriptional regulator [Mycobacteriales bacterium]